MYKFKITNQKGEFVGYLAHQECPPILVKVENESDANEFCKAFEKTNANHYNCTAVLIQS